MQAVSARVLVLKGCLALFGVLSLLLLGVALALVMIVARWWGSVLIFYNVCYEHLIQFG